MSCAMLVELVQFVRMKVLLLLSVSLLWSLVEVHSQTDDEDSMNEGSGEVSEGEYNYVRQTLWVSKY